MSSRWVRETAQSCSGDKANDAVLIEIVSRIRQRPSSRRSTWTTGMAWGLAVAERGYVGLYDIVVAPELRASGSGGAWSRA